MFDTMRIGASAAGAYEIERSLKFNSGDNTRLTRTPSSSADDQKQTYSFWVKRTVLDEYHYVYTAWNGSNTDRIGFRNSSTLFMEFKDGIDTEGEWYSAKLFRDPSAWYHIVVAIDTTLGTPSHRMRAYANGVEITDWSYEDEVDQNYNLAGFGQSGKYHAFGAYTNSGSSTHNHFNGYIADFHFIDGAQKVPADFGKTDAVTGEWVPIEYTGSHGSEGFYLNFSDNSNTTSGTLGADSSSNSNDWTPENFVTGDSVLDSPTNNFATLNPLVLSPNITFTEGDLRANFTSTHRTAFSSIGVSSGKWYFEGYAVSNTHPKWTIGLIDIKNQTIKQVDDGSNFFVGDNMHTNGDFVGLYYDDLKKNGSDVTTNIFPDTITNGEICGVAFDLDNNKIWFSHKGVWANGSATNSTTLDASNHDTTLTANETYAPAFCGETCVWHTNFGQDSSFAGAVTAQSNADGGGLGNFYYPVPSGFKALCTANLPEPTIKNGSDYFNPVLYTGNNYQGTRAITGLDFDPDMLWFKSRSNATAHILFDSVRGYAADKELRPEENQAEGGEDTAQYGYTTALSNGFNLVTGTGGDPDGNAALNVNGYTYLTWAWKESAVPGFDIVAYTGTGSSRTVSHNLGVAPEMMIIKNRDNSYNWAVYHSGLDFPTKDVIYLDLDEAANAHDSSFDNTVPTSSVFTVGNYNLVNASGDGHIAYLFASVEGYSRIGKYIGNGDDDGTFIYTGFKPAAIIIKRTDAAEDWWMWDNKRNPDNPIDKNLYINTSSAEADEDCADFLSNGFKLRLDNDNWNASGGTYIFAAFAETPFKYATAR